MCFESLSFVEATEPAQLGQHGGCSLKRTEEPTLWCRCRDFDVFDDLQAGSRVSLDQCNVEAEAEGREFCSPYKALLSEYSEIYLTRSM